LSRITSPVWIDERDVDDVLRRACEVDPDCTRDAVRRYVQEIAEAAMMLAQVPLDDEGYATSFSPGRTNSEGQQ
jgi:hypothetical protein